jgi:hypothetical protein
MCDCDYAREEGLCSGDLSVRCPFVIHPDVARVYGVPKMDVDVSGCALKQRLDNVRLDKVRQLGLLKHP